LSLPPPIGVYIHWPYCARICPYCDFNVVRDRGRKAEQAGLVRAIAADLDIQAARIGPRRLVSVFFGGGTPSLMEPDWVGDLVALARRLWPSDGPVEVSLEANPTDAEAARFAAFADAGVQRLSLGLQALDDAALAFLGRNHDAAAGRRAAQAAARAFPRLSLDLIYALPAQTEAAWASTLEEAVGIGAEHISPYQLTIEAGTPFDRAVRRARFAPLDEDPAARLYGTTQTVLERLGFEAYEVSNHARGEAARSRHNLIYWRGEDYAGAGPGAHGRLTTPEGRLATEAAAKNSDYIGLVDQTGVGWAASETLDPETAAEERIVMGLRTYEGVTWDELATLGLGPANPVVADLSASGLINVDSEGLRPTRAGRLVLDRVTAELVTAPPFP
jgi:putative oxygen-independent coproporphyrinogen III oxidase